VKPTIEFVEQTMALFSKRAPTLDEGLFNSHHATKLVIGMVGM